MKILILVAGLLIASIFTMLFGGCSTANGLCRDVRSAAEVGIKTTQKYVDRQREGSIAFAIGEQNHIIKQGSKIFAEVSK